MHLVCMVKLSEQFTLRRPTRTQRVEQQQVIEREERKIRDFQDLKAQAEKIRSEEFEEVKSIDEYEKKYNLLNSRLKQFFKTPSEIRQDQIVREKEKQNTIDAELKKEEQRFNQASASFSASSRSRSDEHRLERKSAYFRAFQQRINSFRYGNYALQDILNEARSYADFQERKEKAQQNQRNLRITYKTQLEAIKGSATFEEYKENYLALPDRLQEGFRPFADKKVKTVFEQKAIVEEQEKIIEEKKKELESKPIFFDFKKVDRPSGFIPKGTITDEPRVDFMPITPDVEVIKKDNKIISKVKDIWSKIPAIPLFIKKPSFKPLSFFSQPIISPIETKGSVPLKDVKEKIITDIGGKQRDIFQEEITGSGLKAKLDIQFQEEFQTRFERKHFEDIVRGNIDFETAEKQFAESDEAKIIAKKYDIAVTEARAGKFTKGGFKIAGLELVKTGVKFIPTTTKGAVVESVLIYTGVKVLKTIPTLTINIGTGVIGGLGTFQALSPTSSPETKAGGVITAGLSFGSLSIQGIKFLRRPTIKTIKIKPPKITVKASETIGKDIKIIGKDGEVINRIIFEEQKLSQIGVEGRRTLVNTKWREILRLDPIYRGVPQAQRGTTYALRGLRSEQYYLTKGGYQKAIDLLIKRGGFTKAQAQRTLRFIAPKIIEQDLSSGFLVVKDGKATGEFIFQTKQPVINVDELLGIKTRGARTIKDIFDVERKLISFKDRSFIIQDQTRVSFFLKRGASPFDFKDIQFSRSVIFGKEKVGKGFEVLKSDIKGIQTFKQVEIKDLTSASFTKSLLPSENVLRIDIGRTKLVKKLIDLSGKGFGTPVKIKKTPLSKTFGTGEEVKTIKNIIKDINKISIPLSPKGAIQTIKETARTTQTAQQLKSALDPMINIKQQIKNIVDIGQKTKSLSKVGVLSETALLSLSTNKFETKQQLKSISKFKLDIKLKDLIKEDFLLKQTQIPVSRTKQVQQVQQIISEQSLLISVSTPLLKIPSIKTPTIKTPVIPIFFPSAKRKKKRSKREKKLIQELLFLPDFTARALGLEARTISEKQAKAQLKKILTGLEIRRAVKVKF